MALGKWQMVGFTSWKGTSKDNHIGAIYRKSPQKASDVMIQLLSLHYGKNTEAYLKQFPVKYFDNDDDYFWEVIGSSRRNIPLLEARREDVLFFETEFFRHRIIPASSPGMTAKYPSDGKPKSFQWTVLFYSLHSIFRTSRGIPTGWRFQWRNSIPVKVNWQQNYKFKDST